MKDVIQVKTELIQHQHDALIEFYKTYPRLYVNKVLLRLCESCFPMYPPTLANFISTEPMEGAERRTIVVRIDKQTYPLLWQFYQDLPYGARSTVFINVLNSYVQIAEADKQLMEKAYWGSLSPDPGKIAADQVAVPRVSHLKAPLPATATVPLASAVDKREGEGGPQTGTTEQVVEEDPLTGFKVDL